MSSHPDDDHLLALAESATSAGRSASADSAAAGSSADADADETSAGALAGARDLAAIAGARDHVASCRECSARVDAFRAAATLVASASPASRAWCPPRESLFDAVERADAARAPLPERLSVHVRACPPCRDDVRDLRALALDPDAGLAGQLASAASALVETLRAKLVLALEAGARGLRVVESALDLGLAPALAPARGEATATAPVVVVAPFGPGKLEVSWVAARGGVDLRAKALGGAPPMYRLALWSRRGDARELLESRSADDSGAVALGGLEVGTYELGVYGPQRREPDVVIELELR